MTTTHDDGGPAYPVREQRDGNGNGITEGSPGMSLRDWLAGQALPAIIATYVEANGRCIGTDHAPSNCAAHAYRFADAMLLARKRASR